MVVCREDDEHVFNACNKMNDVHTAIAVKVERDFLSALMGGCSTPISALAVVQGNEILFKGNIVLPDGSQKAEIEKTFSIADKNMAGQMAAEELLKNGGEEIIIHMNK